MALDHPQHPGNPLFQQAFTGVGQLDNAQGRSTDSLSYNLSGALALAAKKGGLERIDRVVLSDDASRAFAVQEGMPLQRFVDVGVMTSINTPLAQSSADWMQCEAPSVQNVRAPALPAVEMRVAPPSM
jgi:hypothetical protein